MSVFPPPSESASLLVSVHRIRESSRQNNLASLPFWFLLVASLLPPHHALMVRGSYFFFFLRARYSSTASRTSAAIGASVDALIASSAANCSASSQMLTFCRLSVLFDSLAITPFFAIARR